MLKSIFVAAALFVGLQANAALSQFESAALTNALAQPVVLDGLFNVGDSADYKLSGGILNGTAHMFVREVNGQNATIEQDLKLGMLGDQKIEMVLDKDSGKCVKLTANGQEQACPDQSKMKVIQSKKDHITVPKGDFDCMYVKIHDDGQNSDSEVWVAPVVPIAHMIKQISQSQIGAITLELTDYAKQ